jgi:hypothetical protein
MILWLCRLLEILATGLALLSPIAIAHWLITATQVNLGPLSPVVDGLTGFYAPFNALVAQVFPTLPTIPYNGQFYTLYQPVGAIFFTLAFFMMTVLVGLLRSYDKHLGVQKALRKQKRELIQARQQEAQALRLLNPDRPILVFVAYNFIHNLQNEALQNQANQHFNSYGHYGGTLVHAFPDGMLAQFHDMEGALRFAHESTKNLLAFYKTLRPSDPQPPYRMVVDALPQDVEPMRALSGCRTLSHYCGENQTLLTDTVRQIMDIKALREANPLESLGFFAGTGGEQIELYLHFPQKKR